MIRFLLFDLDDTILDFGLSERASLTRTLTDFGVSFTEKQIARYHEINAEEWRRLERGECTREEVKLGRFVRFCKEFGIKTDPAILRTTYEENLAKGHFFVEGAQELLERLVPDYRLFLLSNGTSAVQRGRLASAGIEPYFEGIFLSEEIGFVKPQKEFFDYCFARIPGFSKDEALLVGDSLTSDILGGKNAGIATCWFSPDNQAPGEIRPDFTIQTLSELPILLKDR